MLFGNAECGGQQKNRRSGTENTALVLTAAFALERMEANREGTSEKVKRLRVRALEALQAMGVPYVLLSPETAVPHIFTFMLPSLRGQVVQTGLSAAAFDVGIGSACSSSREKGDPALLALGLSPEESRHVIRISLSDRQTPETIAALFTALATLLRQYGSAS